MKLIQSSERPDDEPRWRVVELLNDADPLMLAPTLGSVDRVDLSFPKFSDGRAFSQAWLLRRRLRFQGVIRATGDVLVDQLLQMQRSGLSEAVLREDQDLELGQRLMQQFTGFYQGDVIDPTPRFATPLTGT